MNGPFPKWILKEMIYQQDSKKFHNCHHTTKQKVAWCEKEYKQTCYSNLFCFYFLHKMASSSRIAQFAQFGRKIVCVGRNYAWVILLKRIECQLYTYRAFKYISTESTFDTYIFTENSFILNSEHIAELGNTAPSKPMIFMKPPSTYIKNGTAIEVTLEMINN